MQAKILIPFVFLLLLLTQCKKAVSTTMPDAGTYTFSVNIKDYDPDGRLKSELNVNLEADFLFNATNDTLTVSFEKWFEPIHLVQDDKSQITLVGIPKELVVSNLNCNTSLLTYRMVNRTNTQQYIFEGKKK